MTRLSVDDFLDAFSARLVSLGSSKIRLNEPDVRGQLFSVYDLLTERLKGQRASEDREYRYWLVDLRNAFKPSSIGSFDKLEALFGAKQLYLTSRPNPYYSEVLFPITSSAGREFFGNVEPDVSELVEASVQKFVSTSPNNVLAENVD